MAGEMIRASTITAIPVHGAHAKRRPHIDSKPYSSERFAQVKETYGEFASWAVWAPETDKPKGGIGDLSIFGSDVILDEIHTNFVIVGLNISRIPGTPAFSNFHSADRRSQDYKLRRAIAGTPLWGSYLTDLLKGLEEKSSSKVVEAIRQDPSLLQHNLEAFREELDVVGAKDATIVALGGTVEKLLCKHMGNEFRVLKITHYAHQIASDRYRAEVLGLLEAETRGPS